MPDYLHVPLFAFGIAAAITAGVWLAHRVFPPKDRP